MLSRGYGCRTKGFRIANENDSGGNYRRRTFQIYKPFQIRSMLRLVRSGLTQFWRCCRIMPDITRSSWMIITPSVIRVEITVWNIRIHFITIFCFLGYAVCAKRNCGAIRADVIIVAEVSRITWAMTRWWKSAGHIHAYAGSLFSFSKIRYVICILFGHLAEFSKITGFVIATT